MVSVQGASFVQTPLESAPSLKPYLDQQQQPEQNATALPQQLNTSTATLEQLAAALLSQQTANTPSVMSPQTNTSVPTLFGQSQSNTSNVMGGQANNALAALLSQPNNLASLLEQLGLQASGSGNLLTQTANNSNQLGQNTSNNGAAYGTVLNTSSTAAPNSPASFPDLSDPKLFSLFAGAISAGQSTTAQPDMSDLGVFTSMSQQSTQNGQTTNQWSSLSKEPSQSAVLSALQSIQLKLQVQEQAVEYQNLEKQNQLLISSLLGAQQRIQELQAEVALLQHAMEKIEAAARMAEQEQRMREQVLQQRHAQLTASNMEAEMAIQQMEASLADVHHLHKDLNYNNLVLALSFPGAAENAAGTATPTVSLSAPPSPAPLSAAMLPAVSRPPPSPAHSAADGSVSARSGVSSYANRKCYNCGQKGHRAGDCPNPRTRPDTSADGSEAGADGAQTPLIPASPAKAPAVIEACSLAPLTPDVGIGAVPVSRAPPAAPLAQPSPMTAGLPPKDATPRSVFKKVGAEAKVASQEAPPSATKANQTKLENKPRPPMLNANISASPRVARKQQPPLTPTMVTPPLTPPGTWKNQYGVSHLPPLSPTPVGTAYNRPASRQNVARCIPWQN